MYKIVAPLSTFSSLYNLFLLPILDDEFLNGEAIFSKSELIKMGCHLKVMNILIDNKADHYLFQVIFFLIVFILSFLLMANLGCMSGYHSAYAS